MSHTPVYRTYLLRCPANPGKVEAIAAWVAQWRELATLERDYQIAHFRKTGGKQGLQTKVEQGWTRPWVQDGRCSVTMAQQVMSQVCAQLKGHLELLKNAVQMLIGEQVRETGHTLDANERHRLYSVNRHGLWWARSGVKSPIAGETCVPKAALRRCRTLLLQALRKHAFPNFETYHPQLDQRNARLSFSRKPMAQDRTTGKPKSEGKPNQANDRKTPPQGAAFALWARVSPTGQGHPLELPLVAYDDFLDKLAQTSQALAPEQAARLVAKRARAAEKRKEAGKPPVNPKIQKSLDPARAALPQTLRLILDAPVAYAPSSGKPMQAPALPTLRVAVVLDHSAHDGQLRANYVPAPGKTVAFDLGLSVLLASSEGDLLGRDWMDQLERYALVIDAIAAHRQRLGLPVKSARYDRWVSKLDGFMQTRIHTLLKDWVARVRPERIVVNDDRWDQSPNLSRRMNRLTSRFGKRHLKAALAKLECTHGIVVETRPGAYTSKECHACGYVDARNRASRDLFVCKCCGKQSHADVSAAKVSRDRRSAPAQGAFWPHARHTLQESLNRFLARNPRPEVLEHRPIGRADDPRWSNPYFHTWQQHWTPRVERAEAAWARRKPRPKIPSG